MHSAEEKIKILYEDSLKDIRDLTARIESVATTISTAITQFNNGKNNMRAENERLLVEAVNEIKMAAAQIVGEQENISKSAANAAHSLLMGEAGPVRKLSVLVRQQQEALAWMNRAANFYERAFILWPMVLSATLGALIGGAIVRFL